MPKRVQSPTSINAHKQCPRKYFYQYILKYPTKQNIHCIRGKIVHDALDKFFEINPDTISKETFKKELSFYLKNLFDACWAGSKTGLLKLGLQKEELALYYAESTTMLANWLNHFFTDMDNLMKNLSLSEAFNKLKPASSEERYKDDELMVQGYIDAIHKDGEDTTLMDYKTSKSSELKPEYMLQLGIYAVLYEKKHGKYPEKVGLWFLKEKPVILDVDQQMIKNALFEIEQIHFATESSSINDYPKKESGLCRWSTGQCDFYEICARDG